MTALPDWLQTDLPWYLWPKTLEGFVAQVIVGAVCGAYIAYRLFDWRAEQ